MREVIELLVLAGFSPAWFVAFFGVVVPVRRLSRRVALIELTPTVKFELKTVEVARGG